MPTALHNNRLLFALSVMVALIIFVLFVWTGYTAGQGHLLMPLDDAYIHFQYAKQLASGQPYVYNPGQPATSGATSFIYPYLLAFGYLIGFKGLWLGLWAMLLGTVALIASMWAVYRLCVVFDAPQWLSLLTTLSFALTGSVAWHFMSGMETGLMIAFTLWTLLLVVEKRLYSFIVAASLLTITRPEGGILALIAAGTLFLRLWRDFGPHEKRPGKRWQLCLLVLPIVAIGIQPMVNYVMTGSAIATGNQAKSILAMVPHDWGIIMGRIWDNFTRMWGEFLTGYDGREGRGWYLPLLIGPLGLFSVVPLLYKRGWRLIGWMLIGWFFATSTAISTLDTAFWHFKRYQMPLLVLFFPLAAWTLTYCLQLVRNVGARRALPRYTIPLRYSIYGFAALIIPCFALTLLLQFVGYHRLNVGYVYQQPYQMALWLRENTAQDAVIAVHDVGLMRYIGERTTLDMVGLTTPGAAAYWRNGPGSVAEFLINQQPDYIASYGRGHGYGLAYLADTPLYANPLAEFPIENWQPYANVALAADFQGIYQPDWTQLLFDNFITVPITVGSRDIFGQLEPELIIDVADISSENRSAYAWKSDFSAKTIFVTEVRDFPDAGIHGLSSSIESYRLINGEESFNFYLPSFAGRALILAIKMHPMNSGTIDIYVDDSYIDTLWIPQMPGYWIESSVIIPPEFVYKDARLRIIPRIKDGYYMPAGYVVYRANTIWDPPLDSPLASFQDANMLLGSVEFDKGFSYIDNKVVISLHARWFSTGNIQGDYRFFAHLYDDINQPPMAQWDGYFAGMPVGNWLPGTLSDTITLNIEDVPPGTYQLAIGFYNPQDPSDRLIPTSDVYEVSPDGRLWLGEITIGDGDSATGE